MNENFKSSFEKTIGHEGGFQNDYSDRGNWTSGVVGKGQRKGTKYGVTAMTYPNLDIKNLTLEQARDIYLRDYWNKAKCDELPSGLDYLVFDSAVNHGPSRALKFLQSAVGTTPDGLWGPKTRAAAKAVDPTKAIDEFCVTRMLFYTGLSTWRIYSKGWTRRLLTTHREALGFLGDRALDYPREPKDTQRPREPEVPEETTNLFSILGFRRVT